MKGKNRNSFLIGFIVILSVLISFACVHHTRYKTIDTVEQFIYQEGMGYGLFSEGDTQYLFSYELNTGKSKYYPLEEGYLWTIAGGEGSTIHAYYKQDGNTYITSFDFDTGEMTLLLDLGYLTFNYVNIHYREDYGFYVYFLYEDTVSTYSYQDGTLKLLSSQKTVTDHGNFVLSYILNSGETCFVYADGSMAVGEGFFQNDGSFISQRNTDFLYGDYLYFTNLDEGKSYYLDENMEPQAVTLHFKPTSFDENTTSNVYYVEDENLFFGYTETSEGSVLPFIYGEDSYDLVIEKIAASWLTVCITALVSFFLSLFVLWGLVALINYYLKKETGIPVSLIVTLFLLPITIFCYFAGTMLMEKRLGTESLVDFSNNTYLLSNIYTYNISWDIFEDYYEQDYMSLEDSELLLEELNRVSALWYTLEDTSDIDTIYYEFLYFFKDDAVYSADGLNLLNIPLDDFLSYEAYSGLYESFSENKIVSHSFTDYAVPVYSLIVPIENEEGIVLGGLELMFLAETVDDLFTEQLAHTKLMLLQVLVGLYLVTCLICHIAMRHLASIRKAAKAMMQGDLKNHLNLKGISEVSRLGQSLDTMSRELDGKLHDIHALDQSYDCFLPEYQFRLLHEEGLSAVNLGDSTDIMVATITTGRHLEDGDYFTAYNKAYGREVDYIVEEKLGLVSFYQERPRFSCFDFNKVIDTALHLLSMNRDTNLYLSVVRQNIALGVIGSKESKVLTAISQDTSFTEKMQALVEKYEIPLLVTGEISVHCQDFFSRYELRKLGYLKVGYLNKYEALYEVLQGYSQEAMRKKMDSRENFEEALRLFMSGKSHLAVRKFLQVLATDPEDLVAKEYVFLCQEAMASQEEKDFYFAEF